MTKKVPIGMTSYDLGNGIFLQRPNYQTVTKFTTNQVIEGEYLVTEINHKRLLNYEH